MHTTTVPERHSDRIPENPVLSDDSVLRARGFLHHVLDEWFETEVRPRLKGGCTLVRFADDAVMAFENFLDAKRVLDVLGKRFARYGLSLHPDKTRFVDFRNNRPGGTNHPETNVSVSNSREEEGKPCRSTIVGAFFGPASR
jgi:hypothetical protein